jgi:Antitoxin MazE-like
MANSTNRVRKYREKMKAAGLKPVTMWLPDVDAPGFKQRIAREIEMINNSADEKLILKELGGIEIEG